jgi:RNA polymerase sigma-70 factor (ECF subfamily)
MSVFELSDEDLLGSGSAADFGRFYDRHLDAVVAFVGRRVRQPDAMFDLTAETFARALEHREQYQPSKGPAIAWLLGIARNLIIDSARRAEIANTLRCSEQVVRKRVSRGLTALRANLEDQ